MELMKAVIIHRKLAAEEPQQQSEGDILVLKTVAAVCRHWSRIFERNNSKRQLRRLFHC